ncbi:MAG: PAS domain-containing sensor histidine kinase [Candidatus Omnitrophota bacterium]
MKMKDKKNMDKSKVEIALEYGNSIIATLREPFLVLDKNLRVISANRSFYNTFMVTKEDTLGRPLTDLGNRQWDIPKLLILLKEILPEKRAIENYQIEHEFEQIGRRCINLNVTQLRIPKKIAAIIAAGVREEKAEEEDGEEELILLSIEDITVRKETEAAAKEASEAKSKFTSMVSHELRSPLTVIKESINLVMEGLAGSVTDEQKDILDTAKSNIDRLGRLINNVLDFQKMEAGKMDLDIKEYDINEIVLATSKGMNFLAGEKGMSFTVSTDGSIPKTVFDKDKIIQVLTNLLSNAVKFTEKGAITIVTKGEDNAIHVTVEDTGLGIQATDIPKLFQTFEQLGGGLGKKRGGTGLGLAISKQIIQAHDGKIWAESQPGKGSIFHFTLPIRKSRG